MPQLAPGDVFADHRIEGLAGRGGMGVVYRATQLGLERTVALKLITPALAEDADFRRRFVAESKAAAAIEHPNVVPIYHAGEHDGVLFIVMRYIDGPDLRALVRAEGRLDAKRAAHIVAQVGSALDAAHRHGLVHRDVKPANVLLAGDEQAYLTDFGLTKRVATSAQATVSRENVWVGTLGFVAPEQIRGERVDARTDVYALGCVLVYAVTGAAPFVRESDEATLWAHLNAPPPTEQLPWQFASVVARALSKDPGDRYPSAGDLGRAAQAAAGTGVAATPERAIARGPAAPPGEDETVAIRQDHATEGDETHSAPNVAGGAISSRGDDSAPAAAPERSRTRLARRRVTLAAACLLAATGLAALVAGARDVPTEGIRATTAPSRTAGPHQTIVDAPVHVASPLSLAVAAGRLWVGGRSPRLRIYDALSGKALSGGPYVGVGSHALAYGAKSIWDINTTTNRLVRISARNARRIANATVDLAVPGIAIVVATGARAVWVGVRNRSMITNRRNESVVRVDPSTYDRTPIIVPAGVQDIAVDQRSLWVTNRAASTVTQISTSTLKITNVIRVGRQPTGIAVGAGAVWVAARGDDALTRINPRTHQTRTIRLKAAPDRVAVGGGAVWVTSRAASLLLRIDPRSTKITERISTGYDPVAVDVAPARTIWLALVLENAIQRLRFRDPTPPNRKTTALAPPASFVDR